MKSSSKDGKLTFNQIKILYYVRSVKRFTGSRNRLQELVNIEGGSFDETLDRLIPVYIVEVRDEDKIFLKVTKKGDQAIRFLRIPNYALFATYMVGVGLVVLGFLITYTPFSLLWYVPIAVLAFGFLGIGSSLAYYHFARNYAKEFLQIRDKPPLTV